MFYGLKNLLKFIGDDILKKKIFRSRKTIIRNRIIFICFIFALIGINVAIFSKIFAKKNIVVQASNTIPVQTADIKSTANSPDDKNSNKTDATTQKSNDAAMNSRESKIPETSTSNSNADASAQSSNDQKSVQPPGEYTPWSANDGKKVAYLTFDDGPSTNNTPKVLDILKKNDIKATFFLIGKNAETNKELVKRELSEGHVLGNHTYSHQINYAESPQQFVQDLDKCDTIIKSIVGNDYNVKLARFPGGSSGPKLAPFREAAKNAGYHYVDWNDLTGDAERNNVPVADLLNNLKKYTIYNHVVILMHDATTKNTSVEALPQVIEYLKSKDYTFDTLK